MQLKKKFPNQKKKKVFHEINQANGNDSFSSHTFCRLQMMTSSLRYIKIVAANIIALQLAQGSRLQPIHTFSVFSLPLGVILQTWSFKNHFRKRRAPRASRWQATTLRVSRLRDDLPKLYCRTLKNCLKISRKTKKNLQSNLLGLLKTVK